MDDPITPQTDGEVADLYADGIDLIEASSTIIKGRHRYILRHPESWIVSQDEDGYWDVRYPGTTFIQTGNTKEVFDELFMPVVVKDTGEETRSVGEVTE